MSSTDITIIEKTIQSLLLPNNVIRKQAEEQLSIWMQNKESLSIYLSHLLLSSSNSQVKTYCAIILRKIYLLTEDMESEVWVKISNESKPVIKTNLLTALIQNTDSNLKKKIVDAIIPIFSALIENDEKWDDLLMFTIKGFSLKLNEENFQAIGICLYLLAHIYNFAHDELKEGIDTYIMAFKTYFTSNSLFIKAKTVNCLSELLCGSYTKKESRKFRDLIFYILETTLQCFNANDQENLNTCLNSLKDLTETEPKILRKSFSDIFILIGEIVESHKVDDSLREIGFELLVSLISEIPKTIEKDTKKLALLIQSIFKYAMEIGNTIDEDWKTPITESFIIDDFIPEHKLDESISLLKRLLECLNEKSVLSILSDNIIQLLKHSDTDWKYKYIAYISIGSIFEYIKEFGSIKQIVEIIIVDMVHPNIKIQYASLFCISNLSEEYNPSFQVDYHNKIIPQCIAILQSTNVLRIQLQVCDSLDLFIENLPENEFGLYMQNALDCLFNVFLRNDNESPCSLKEGILAVVSTLHEYGKQSFTQYAEKTFKILLEYLSKILKENTNRNLIGALFELIAAIGPLCPELLNTYLVTLVETILQIQFNMQSFKDNIANYLHSTWEKILPLIISSNKELVKKIIESFIYLLKKRPEMSITGNPEVKFNIADFFKEEKEVKKQKEQPNITTSETEEYTTFIETLNLILKDIPEAFIEHIDLIYAQAINLLKYPNEEIQLEIAETFSLLLISISKLNNQSLLHSKAKTYVSDIITQLEKETSFSITVGFLDSVQEIINTAGMFLTTVEINQLSARVIQIFDKIETLRLSLNQSKERTVENLLKEKQTGENKIYSDDEDEGSEEEVLNQIKNEIDNVEEVQTSISEFFGCLFKTHKQLSLEIVDKLIKEYLPKFLAFQSSVFQKQLGLLIVVDMISFLGQDLISPIWNDIAKILLTYIIHPDYELKGSAAYGIGLFAQYTTSKFAIYSKELLEGLEKGLESLSKKDKNKKDDWKNAKDSIVSAFGKIIKYQGQLIDVNKYVDTWINLMPLKNDISEGKIMNEFLIEILQKNSQLVLGENNKNLTQIIQVLFEVYNTSQTSEECNIHIKDYLKKLNSSLDISPIIQNIISSTKKIEKRNNMMRVIEE